MAIASSGVMCISSASTTKKSRAWLAYNLLTSAGKALRFERSPIRVSCTVFALALNKSSAVFSDRIFSAVLVSWSTWPW